MIPDLLKRNINWIKELDPQYGEKLELIFKTHKFEMSDQKFRYTIHFRCMCCEQILTVTPDLKTNPWADILFGDPAKPYEFLLTCTETIIKDIIE
jgi:hypothetical protein